MAERKKITVRDIVKMKGQRPIVMITAYDTPTARIVDESGVDMILVGDSLGMVVLGMESTLQVTMEDMLRHTAAVARASPRALVVGDMPFLSYEVGGREAVENAGLFLRAGADAVKIEGGSEYVDVVRSLVRAGIPVMGHVGLTPQKHKLLGGYRLMGKTASEALSIIRDAEELSEAGVFSIVIEFTSWEVAKKVTERVKVPTICIGSGPYCDGQVVVLHDIIGLTSNPPPFTRVFRDAASVLREAVREYAAAVKERKFPERGMYWGMKEGEYEKLERLLSAPRRNGDFG
jgi:3-methyl-2-oxobutanoate hydroxymethyltransferase